MKKRKFPAWRTAGDRYQHRVASYRVAESILDLSEQIERESRVWIRDQLKQQLTELQTEFNNMTRDGRDD